MQAIAELKSNALDTVYHTGIAIDEVLARYGSSGNRTLLTDALMSVIAQANDSQAVENFYAYSPYGQVQTLGPDGGNSLQYTGRENDQTGLYYYRARYRDPAMGWLSEDPIGIAAGINVREYVGGDPISYIDPFGLIDWSLPQGVVDFSAGLGDVLLFGQGQGLRDFLGVSGGVNQTSRFKRSTRSSVSPKVLKSTSTECNRGIQASIMNWRFQTRRKSCF